MANANKNAKATTQTTKTNEIAPAAITRFSVDEIANKIVNLIISRNSEGEILIANTIEDDSIINNCKFVRAAVTFIESVKDGNAYDAVSSLTEICTNPRYADGLTQIVEYLKSSNSDFAFWIKNCLGQRWRFNDSLLNTLWNMKNFNRSAAIVLYGMVSYLADTCFSAIEINGYFGDTAGLGSITTNCSVFFKDSWDD